MMIRQASPADAPLVLEFLRRFRAEGLETVLRHESLPTLEAEEAFIRILNGAAGIMLLALDGAGVVGCLTAETQPHPQLHHSCEFGMGVSAACRGSGVGTRLVGSLLAWARQRGLRRVELTVFAHNAAAIRLYRRLGFAEEGRKVGAVALDSRYEDAILMAIQVDPVSTAPASG